MRADSPRWVNVTPSQFAHERAGLLAVRELLPEAEPYRAWANLEFIGDDGSANEVDLLVLARNGLHLIELKHWRGTIAGNGTTWLHNAKPVENPLLLATRKAKRLRSLLERVARDKASKTRVPFVRASILLHAPDVTVTLDPAGRTGVYALDGALPQGVPGISEDLLTAPLRDERDMVDGKRGKEIAKLLDQAGIRRSVRSRTVGSVLVDEDAVAEGPGWQDYLGHHTSLEGVRRRVRFYLVDRAATRDARDTVRRAAGREFAVLEGIAHPGIARATDYVDHERGPAVIFERDHNEERLDHFLTQYGASLGLDAQLQIIRSLAETIRYAHARRVVHRALNPGAITVRRVASGAWGVRVQDWQTGVRGAGSQPSTAYVSGTRHLDALIDASAAPYIAPEAYTNPQASGVTLDVFGLGAIAYRVLTGQAPATGADDLLRALSAQGGGLDVAVGLDGAPEQMRELVREATWGDVELRTETAADFLAGLDAVEDALTTPEVEAAVDPLEAVPGDVLDRRFTVVQRLGTGSTARALLVTDSNRPAGHPPVVLKVALEEAKADRLREEAEVLGEVRERRVVALLDGPLSVGGRTALVLEDAGRESLAELIRREGRLSIDLLERWGRDLLEVTAALDDVGVNHRDIKPDNLAYGELGTKHRRVHLRLFDFSLSRAPLDQIRAGTPPYLDPFFDPVLRPRWDAAAERYAVAVTLFEMATGTVPIYGGGESHPTQVEDEATVDAEMFDPAIADGLVAFFSRALRRAPRARFDTVADTAQAWAAVFAEVPQAAAEATADPLPGDDRDALAAVATLATSLKESGLTPRAVSALGKYDVTTVGELLALGGFQTSKIARVSEATRKEIRRRVRAWREALGAPAAPEVDDAADAAAPTDSARGVDAVLARLLPPPGAHDTTETTAVRLLLGMADPTAGAPLTWPTPDEVSAEVGLTAAHLREVAAKARTHWGVDAVLAEIAGELIALLEDAGGVMGAGELARALLATRGSTADEPLRTTQAVGLVRAAIEVEQERGGASRVDLRRTPAGVLVALEPMILLLPRPASCSTTPSPSVGWRPDSRAKNRCPPRPAAWSSCARSRHRRAWAPSTIPGCSTSPPPPAPRPPQTVAGRSTRSGSRRCGRSRR